MVAAREGAAGFAGRTRVHLRLHIEVVSSGRIVFLSSPHASLGCEETSCPSFPTVLTLTSFAARPKSCFVPPPTASRVLGPGFAQSQNE
jgi:hypothetical protein